MNRPRKWSTFHAVSAVQICLLAGCLDPGGPTGSDPADGRAGPQCTIDLAELFDGGVGRDGIPALTNPTMVPADHPDASYLSSDDRVIGVRGPDGHLAIPLNILWFHEVVNLDLETGPGAVTYCPLTGSSLVVDRTAVDGRELGVSGLIFRNNLIVFDRGPDGENQSLWVQMLRRSVCGPARGTMIPLIPSIEITWEGWLRLNPETVVVSSRTGFNRNYSRHPNPGYEELHNGDTFFPRATEDDRRPPKERILGIPLGLDGGMAFPFEELKKAPVRALRQPTPYGPIAVFWDREVEGAAAYHADLDGRELRFRIEGGRVVDDETGSTWNLMGAAVEGPFAGRRLEPFTEAYVAFWFAWADFQPETAVWSPFL